MSRCNLMNVEAPLVWERKVVAASLQIQTFSLWCVFQYATVTSQSPDSLIIGYFVKPFIFFQPLAGELGVYARFSLWTGTRWCCCFYLHGVLKFLERGTFKAMNWVFFAVTQRVFYASQYRGYSWYWKKLSFSSKDLDTELIHAE